MGGNFSQRAFGGLGNSGREGEFFAEDITPDPHRRGEHEHDHRHQRHPVENPPPPWFSPPSGPGDPRQRQNHRREKYPSNKKIAAPLIEHIMPLLAKLLSPGEILTAL